MCICEWSELWLNYCCRLYEPESVKFFQFDSDGNMYVSAPGAGCIGEATLVQPGDYIIFSGNS